jgi:uncharacterized protein
MITKKSIDEFLGEKIIAVAGVSRNKNKFGSQIFKDLIKKGYRVYPVNPFMSDIEGEKCYKSLSELPEKPGSVVVCVNKNASYDLSVEALNSGIRNIWFQSGAESETALEFCKDNNMNVIHNECILMFAEPAGFHKFHRWVNGVFGKLPA